jgi:cell filamentation protein
MADYFADDNPLKNKLGISDPRSLHETEETSVANKTAELFQETPPNDFDLIYVKHIHKVLFEDIYDFAGHIRTVDITKPDSAVPFAHVEYIESEAGRIFGELKSKNYLVGLNREDFIQAVSELSADLNALHPFREGNGRTIRLFLILLADQAGYLLNYGQVSTDELIKADKLAFEGDIDPLIAVYQKVVMSKKKAA